MDTTIDTVIASTIHSLDNDLHTISQKIHNQPELGNEERQACQLLTDYLDGQGFKVTHEVAGLKTAWVAEYSNGPGRRVGFCSEYDALPGIGHGCGHNLIAISGVACAMAIKALLEQNLAQGSVVLFGTPAEETTSGKITLTQHNEFQRRVDVALMLHPFDKDSLYKRFLALDTMVVEFFGRAAHAGMSPWEGINAVDALMQGYDNASMLRQQLRPENRFHGIITHGGKAANVIPDYAAARFYARSVTRDELASLKPKLENCFKAAAIATGCEIKLSWGPLGPVEDVLMNTPMAECYKRYMEQEGVVFQSRVEEEGQVSGSTDMGNVSYAVPSIHPAYGINTTAANHTVEFTAAAKTDEAHRLTMRAAKCLSLTAAQVLLSDEMYDSVVKAFKTRSPQ